MISLFTWATDDQSIYYLDQIFGYMDNVLPAPEGATTIISVMLKTVNTTALIIGALLIISTTIRGLLKTAQEGEFLGKEWSSLWVPVRTVVGVASLFPTAAGYSLLQIALMWVIVQGIGAADTLWVTVLKYIQVYKSPYSVVVSSGKSSAPVPTSSSSNSGTSITIPSAMKNLFYALTCQETLARKDSDVKSLDGSNIYYCAAASKTSSDPFCAISANDRTNILATPSVNGVYTFSMGPSGTCGTMTFPDPETYTDPNPPTGTTPVITCKGTSLVDIETCAGIKQQVTTLQSIVGTLSALASSVAEADHQYIEFAQGYTPAPVPATIFKTPAWVQQYCTANSVSTQDCCFPINAPPGYTCALSSNFPLPYLSSGLSPWSDNSNEAVSKIIWPFGIMPAFDAGSYDQVGLATNKYIGDVNTAVSNAAVGATTITDSDLSTASDDGWLVAGTYYYDLASKSNATITSEMPPFSVTAADPSLNDNTLTGFRINFNTATEIENTINNQSATGGDASKPPAAASAASNLNGMTAAITGSFMNSLSGGGTTTNPLIAAQAFGENLLIAAQVTYVPMLIASTVLITLSNINVMVFGSGLTENPFGPGTEFATGLVWALYMFFAGWCFTFGGMLAIYMPLVPYIIFSFAAIGWFISVLEAMVAAPFVAIGIMSPTGHEMFGRAEPAVMIILSTFLRPTLLILGMMSGMILAPLVITMINGGFNIVVGSIYGGAHAPGPVELILFITAYGSLVCAAMNKCFAIIYLVPDRVLTWIGGQPTSGGEAEGLREVKGSFDAATDTLKDAAASGGSMAHEHGRALGRKTGEENKELGKRFADAQKAEISAKGDDSGSSGGAEDDAGGGGGGGGGTTGGAGGGTKKAAVGGGRTGGGGGPPGGPSTKDDKGGKGGKGGGSSSSGADDDAGGGAGGSGGGGAEGGGSAGAGSGGGSSGANGGDTGGASSGTVGGADASGTKTAGATPAPKGPGVIEKLKKGTFTGTYEMKKKAGMLSPKEIKKHDDREARKVTREASKKAKQTKAKTKKDIKFKGILPD